MKETIFNIGHKDFDFLVYNREELFNEKSYPISIRVYDPVGDRTETVNLKDKTILNAADSWEFDACNEYRLIRPKSQRGKRRSHILTIASKCLRRDVHVLRDMLTKDESDRLIPEVTMLLTLVQGVRVQFPSENLAVYYQLNVELYRRLMETLHVIGKRVIQTSPLADYESLMPEFGDGSVFPLKGIYNRNDWEILATAFICEAESFLKMMLVLGYDFEEPVLHDPKEEDEEDDEEDDDKSESENIPGSFITKTPIRVNPLIKAMVSGTQTIEDLFASAGRKGSKPTANPDVKKDSRPRIPSLNELVLAKRETKRRNQLRSDSESDANSKKHDTDSEITISKDKAQRSPNPFKAAKTLRFKPETPQESRIAPTSFEASQVSSHYGISSSAPYELSTPEVNSDRYYGLFRRSRFDSSNNQAASFNPTSSSFPQHFSNSSEMNKANVTPQNSQTHVGGTPGGDPDNSDDDSDSDDVNNNRNQGKRNMGKDPPDPPPDPNVSMNSTNSNPSKRGQTIQFGENKWVNTSEIHFETKLKPDIISTWDGDDEVLGSWIRQINELSEKSASLFVGLGDIVPTRFKGKAKDWWYSLSEEDRRFSSQNWSTLRERIRTYWMNQAWINKMQSKALRSRFRESGHGNESPTEYFIRKSELLTLVYNFTPKQIVHEILKTAPAIWHGILQPANLQSLSQLQSALRYNEENLNMMVEQFEPKFRKRDDSKPTLRSRSRTYAVDTQPKKAFKPQARPKDKATKGSRTYAIGWSGYKPEYPRDDSNVSKGRTPEDLNARPCMFCGSLKHWDRDCKHASKGRDRSRSRFAETSVEVFQAEVAYEDAYQFSRNDDYFNDEPSEDQSCEEADEEDNQDDVIESYENSSDSDF